MTIPTAEEIKAARDAIRADGPMADATIALGLLVAADPILRGYCETLAANAPAAIQMMIRTKQPQAPDSAMLVAFIRGAFVGGLYYGLRISDARVPLSPAPTELAALNLHAWVGEDELGSGQIGLKQGLVPAGYIPLVATRREKIEGLLPQMEAQAARYGKKIRLCMFRFVEVLRETASGK